MEKVYGINWGDQVCFSRDACQYQAFSSPDHSPDRALTSRYQEGKLTELPAFASLRRHAGKGPGVRVLSLCPHPDTTLEAGARALTPARLSVPSRVVIVK